MAFSTLLLIFISLGSFSVIFNYVLLRWTKTLGAKNQIQSEQIRWSESYKPAIGGISFFIVFILSYLIYLFQVNPDLSQPQEMIHFGILLAVTIGFFAGLADDTFNTIPWLKFLAQIFCGLLLLYFDLGIDFFGNTILDAILTLFWITAVMNSINMLDNMDAITGIVSISILICASIFAIPMTTTNLFYAFICGGTIMGIFGFMWFNWNPSKMYMGDTGSQMLGALLAAIGIVFFWNNESTIQNHEWLSKIAIVLTVFVVPISDSMTVSINRIRRGQSPFVGGRDHTTHHLSYAGLNDKKVAYVFIALSLISIAFILGLRFIPNDFLNIYLTGMMIISFGIIYFLYSTTKWKKSKATFQLSLTKSTTND